MSTTLRTLVVKVGADVSGFEKGLNKASKKLKATGRSFTAAGKSLTRNVSVPLIALGAISLKAGTDFESAFAGVRKTVEATEEEYKKLSDGIRALAKQAPTTAEALAGIAESAGQLGIKTEGILQFTKVVADLGVTTNLTGEDAASMMAKFANISQMPQDEFDRFGSTIVDLGNNLATTEADILEMGLRLAGAGKQVGLSESEVLSIAGALSSVGLQAQAGGTAISKVLIEMQLATETGGNALKDFAKVAGLSTSEFSTAFKTDATSALSSFITGLQDTERNGASAIKVLDDMGITEIRMRDALLRLSNAEGLLDNSLETGTKAWAKNTALTEEAQKRYETTASKTLIMRNRLNDVAITLSDALIPAAILVLEAIKPIIESIDNLATKFAEASPETQRFILKLGGVLILLGPVLTMFGGMFTGLGKLTKGLSLASKAFGAGKGLMGALSALMGPVGIALAAIVALAGAAYLIIKYWEPIKEFFGGIADTIRETAQAFDDLAQSKREEEQTGFEPIEIPTRSTGENGDPSKRGVLYPLKDELLISQLATGTNYVPQDMVAMLHKGESVTPEKYNKGSGVTVNFYDAKIMSDRDMDLIGTKLVKQLKLAGVKV